jgi:hypothetical protein
LGAPAAAETIYGTLAGNGGPARAHLVLTCGGVSAETDTDAHGSYRLTIGAKGRCQLQISVGNAQAPSELVFVYDEPTRYDYEVQTGAGSAHIVRR